MLFCIFDEFSKKNPIKSKINDANILKEIETAKNEWEYALKRFNDVSEPDVVDYIVYYIIAAERRYMYLLNRYKTIKEEERNRPK